MVVCYNTDMFEQNLTMPPAAFPEKVLTRFVHFSRPIDLPALCRVNKLLSRLAEPKIYRELVLKDLQSMYSVMSALLADDGKRASFVRRLWLFSGSCLFLQVPRGLWNLIRDALLKMDSLQTIYLVDPDLINTWIFPLDARLKIREAILHFAWDERFAAFLNTQTELRFLSMEDYDFSDDADGYGLPCPLAPGSLPALETFDGPLPIAQQLLSSPLKQLHMTLDAEIAPTLVPFIQKLARRNKCMRSLDIILILDYLVVQTLRTLAESPLSSSLRYLGVIMLSPTQVSTFYSST